jgi:hypothetical protein
MANGGDVHIKADDGSVHGNGGNVEINGGIGGITIKGGDGGVHPTEYPGGATWVDKAYDPYFMELPPDEKFRRLKAIGRWLKEHVLAAVIIFILTTILGIYIKQWLLPPQDQTQPPISAPKVMRV